MAKRYIISDLHFGHFNIIEFGHRPFTTVEEMDESIIERWNSVVTKEDIVYLVGDVSLNSMPGLKKVKRLNGHKRLIKGNHDNFGILRYLNYFEQVDAYLIENNIIISHIPVLLNLGDRFIGNIHGHTHEKDIDDKHYLNISWEKLNGYPILLEEAKDKLIDQILNT